MSGFADPYARNTNSEYRERMRVPLARSPDCEYERSRRERSSSSDAYGGGGSEQSASLAARYRDRSPQDYRSPPRSDERRRRHHRSSRDRELSRERDRERDRDRERGRRRERERGRDRAERDRSYSRGGGGHSPWQNDSDEEPSSRFAAGGSSSSRDRHYDERRDERRRRSYDDDRSSRGGSYDSDRSKRDSDHDRPSRTSRTKDEWLAHVWGESARSGDGAGFGGSNVDHDAGTGGGGGGCNFEHFDRSSYKSQTPNKTLIIRGLGPYVTERDIRDEMIRAGGNPRDIRLIRKKDTGSSRGFAFVEFGSTEEARYLVERYDGEFRLLDQRVIMQYSIQRDFEKEVSADWYCRCSALNFKRREFCYRCGSDRRAGECPDADETSLHPTHTVLLKGLDLATTEENVLKAIQTLSSLPIRSVRVGRDKVTNVSRGACYLEMNNVSDAMYLHNALLTQKLRINGRTAYVSYCKNIPAVANVTTANASNAGNAAIAAAQWSHQRNSDASAASGAAATSAPYTLLDVPRLAAYSASLYAKTTEESDAFVKHYTDYYTKSINEGRAIPSLDGVSSNPSSTGYQDASSTSTSSSSSSTARPGDQGGGGGGGGASTGVLSAAPSNLPMAPSGQPPSGAGDYCYLVPDVSTYQYDKTSGYYYDPNTTLYYDANSQYYFNAKINKFLYWDGHRRTYLLAPTGNGQATNNGEEADAAARLGGDAKSASEDERRGRDRVEDKDKVKVAKRIAKDMEKWAKTLNHKKEIAKQNLIATHAAPVLRAQGAADIGYTVGVLGRKDSNSALLSSFLGSNAGSAAAAADAGSANDSLVAEYGQGSESEDETDELRQQLQQQDDKHVDWSKMACLLCKRAFPNQETLLKHQQLSELHKQNLEAFYRSTGISVEDAKQKSVQYRDRAKERRVKYNEPDVPPANRLKENYMKAREATVSYEEPTRHKIGGDNVGNKLLQKMGWQEGMGLGKSNQGRTDIIQAEARPVSAGLGIRTQGVTPAPGETYKDCVKKMMRARYEEVDNR